MPLRKVTFPTELHNIIVDILAEEGDLVTVKDLALTCRSILPTCQSHIFATLDLLPNLSGQSCHDTAENFSQKFDNLRSIFKHNPDLAFYVRNVHYMVRPYEDKYQNFHAVLQRLPRVKALVLKGTISRTDCFKTAVDWSTLSASLRKALHSIFSSPCFSQLHLDYISDFPIQILLECKNLTHLTIESADFDDCAALATNDVLVLRSLTFTEYSSRAVRSLINAKNENGLPVVDFTQLRQLKSLDKTGDVVVRMLLETSKALESITCTVWDTFTKPFCNILKPNTLKTLKSFDPIIIIPPWLGLVDLDPLYCLPEEFEKWMTRNIIEEIHITVSLEKNAGIPKNFNSWTTLNALAAENAFPFLREVSLSILLPKNSSAQEVKDRLEARQNEIFRPFMDNPKIDFRFTVQLVHPDE